jgi:hypothetical protein
MFDHLIKRFCNSSWSRRALVSEHWEPALTRTRMLFVELLMIFLDVTTGQMAFWDYLCKPMVFLHLSREAQFKDMCSDDRQFLTPGRRLHIALCYETISGAHCSTLPTDVAPQGLELVDVQCGGSVDSSWIVTAKATIALALPNSVQWRIIETIDTLCVAFSSLVSVAVN